MIENGWKWPFSSLIYLWNMVICHSSYVDVYQMVPCIAMWLVKLFVKNTWHSNAGKDWWYIVALLETVHPLSLFINFTYTLVCRFQGHLKISVSKIRLTGQPLQALLSSPTLQPEIWSCLDAWKKTMENRGRTTYRPVEKTTLLVINSD